MAIPTDPQNLQIAFEGARAATEGLLKWSPPVNTGGLPFLSYEVAVSEGGSIGSTWVDTQSRRTRYLAKELARGTEHTFAVRARNADGVGPVSNLVTMRTPICSLHNALFFKDCVNYFDHGERISEHGTPSHIIRAAGDNNYRTFTDVEDLNINIAVNGQPTRVDAIFLMCENVDSYALTPTGGQGTGVSNRVIPQTVTRWEGTAQSIVMNGIQHELYLIPDGHFTATSVRLQLTGTGVRLYEVMLLEFGLEMNANGEFTQILPKSTDRTFVIHPNLKGGIQRKPLGVDERERWVVDLVAKFVPGKTLIESAETFRQWRMRNYNHVFVQEYTREPWYVYPASFLKESVALQYRTDDKNAGVVVPFQIGER